MGPRPGRRTALLISVLASVALAASQPQNSQDAYREASALCDRGEWIIALQTIDDALARFGARDDDAVWSLRVLRGTVLIARNQPQEALKTPELPQRLRLSEAAVQRLRILAIASHLLSHFDEAHAYLEQAHRLAQARHPRLESDILLVRANFAAREGKPEQGEMYARQMLRVARRWKDARAEMNAFSTLALLCARREHYDEAIEAGEEALRRARSLGMQSAVQKIEGNLGWAYSELGDDETASELFADANAVAAKLGATYDQVTWLVQLGNVTAARRDYAGAAQRYRQAISTAAGHHPKIGAALANLAWVSFLTGDYDAAQRWNGQALEAKRQSRDAEGELRSTLMSGRIAMALGHSESAEEAFRHVAQETKSKAVAWEAHVRVGQLFAKTKPALAEDEFQTALRGWDEARAEVKDVDLRLSFVNSVAEFYNAYIDFLVEGGRAADALDIAELSRARTLQEGLGVKRKDSEEDPKRLAAELHAVLLAYWLGPTRSFLWAVTPDKIALFTLPADRNINAALDQYQKEMFGPRGTLSASGGRGEQLYRMLVEPAALTLRQDAHVIIVPDGKMNVINLETLVVPSPKPHYWIEDVTIETVSSLRLLSRRSGDAGTASMLLIGNPVVSEPGLPPLPRAEAEIERVGRQFRQTTVVSRAKATPQAYVGAEPERYAFIHFVAHGVANRQRPLDSAVILSPDSDGHKLYAREIVRHSLTARLVTISSCHGAGRRTYVGEGLVGLAWAFLRAGAHHVIAALWEVSDSATPELMDAMYAAMRAGDDPATALRKAKLKLLHSSGVYRRPLYWAPFVLYSGA